MAHIDFKKRTVTAKIVYYGCGFCGKTRNLEYINEQSREADELVAVSTEGDRTIFFDFLPLSLGKVRGISTQFKLYAVPGQVRYNMTRKLVLKDVDGVVFVVDSQRAMLRSNLDSLENLYENLKEQGVDPASIPIVLQYNKRDLDNVMSVEDLNGKINQAGYAAVPASALSGNGVFETLDQATRLVFERLWKQMGDGAADEEGQSGNGEKQASTPATATDREGTDADAPVSKDATEQGNSGGKDETVDSAQIGEGDGAVEGVRAGDAQSKEKWEGVAAQLQPFLDPFQATTSRLEALVESLQQCLHSAENIQSGTPDGDGATASPEQPEQSPASDASEQDAGTQGAGEVKGHEAPAAVEETQRELAGEVLKLRERLAEEQGQKEALQRRLESSSGGGSADAEELPRLREELHSRRTAFNEARTAQLRAERKVLELERELRRTREELTRLRDKGAEGAGSGPAMSDSGAAPPSTAASATPDDTAGSHSVGETPEAEASAGGSSENEGERAAVQEQAKSETLADPETYQALESLAGGGGGQDAAAQRNADSAAGGPAERSSDSGVEPSAQEGVPEVKEEATPDPYADDPEHVKARRAARVMVSDLIMYHRDAFEALAEGSEPSDALREALDEARKTYEGRASEAVRSLRNYLDEELQRRIAKQRGKSAQSPQEGDGKKAVREGVGADRVQGEKVVRSDEQRVEGQPPEPESATDDSKPTVPTANEATAPKQAAVAESTAKQGDTKEEDVEVRKAKRVARVMVGDLFLYHSDDIDAGLADGTVALKLEEPIAEAERTFAQRVPESVRATGDFFGEELQRRLQRRAGELGLSSEAPPGAPAPEQGKGERVAAPPAAPKKQGADAGSPVAAEQVKEQEQQSKRETELKKEPQVAQDQAPEQKADKKTPEPRPQVAQDPTPEQKADEEKSAPEQKADIKTPEPRPQVAQDPEPNQKAERKAENVPASASVKKTETAGTSSEEDPFSDDRDHKRARRVARVMVADLFLYNKDLIEAGVQQGNLNEAIEEQLKEARQTFDSRVPEFVRKQRDYFSMEFDRRIQKHATAASQKG